MVEIQEQTTSEANVGIKNIKTKISGVLQKFSTGSFVWLVGWILPAFFLVTWELLSRNGVIPTNLLPAPSTVVKAIYDLAVRGELINHIRVTLFRLLVGFAVGTVISTILGALTGYSARYRRLLDPTLQALRNIPSMAWVPLFLLWLGIYETSKITLIAVGVMFPVYLNLMSGIQTVDSKLLEVGRVFGLSPFQMIRQIVIPATLPAYIIGLRSGMSLGWMFVVAAEIMGASQGLGFLLIDGQMTGRPAIILGSVILFAVFGKLTDLVLAYIGSYLIRWQAI